jgi:hypothetical protein
MTDFLFGKPERDPDLRDALRRLERFPSPVEDDALRAQITQAAEPALGARRQSVRESNRLWWEWTSSWARLALPAGAAVAIGSALLLSQVDIPVTTETVSNPVAASSLLVSAEDNARGDVLLDRVLVPVEQDWLFSEAMVSARPET